jgi:hypothetical protein
MKTSLPISQKEAANKEDSELEHIFNTIIRRENGTRYTGNVDGIIYSRRFRKIEGFYYYYFVQRITGVDEHGNDETDTISLAKLVWQNYTGEVLSPDDIVIHYDGDSTNNCIWNLKAVPRKGSKFISKREVLTCDWCGVEFTRQRSRVRPDAKHHFCCSKHSYEFRRKDKHGKEN